MVPNSVPATVPPPARACASQRALCWILSVLLDSLPLLPCAASWEADLWEPGAPVPAGFPLGSARGGGGRRWGRCWESVLGVTAGWLCSPSSCLTTFFFFLISFFNWGLITILWPCLERPLQAPVTCSSANSSRPGGGESSPLPTLGMWNRPLLISSNRPAPL